MDVIVQSYSFEKLLFGEDDYGSDVSGELAWGERLRAGGNLITDGGGT